MGAGHDMGRAVPGLHPVRELLRAGAGIHAVHVAAGRSDDPILTDILALAERCGVAVRTVGAEALDDLAGGVAHQGVVATAPAFPYVDLDGVTGSGQQPALVVALDHLTDPHNLGAIARTAEVVGADGLVIPIRRAAPVTPAAEKAAAGALAHLPVARVTNLVRALDGLFDRGLWRVGLDAGADTDLYGSALLTEPVCLVVGSEGGGLARLSRVHCDELVRLPVRGRVASLNASVAVAVALYEALRRRVGSGG